MICTHLLAHTFIKFEQCNKKNIEKYVLCVQYRYTQTIYDKKYHRHPLNKFSPELHGSLIQNEKMEILFQR